MKPTHFVKLPGYMCFFALAAAMPALAQSDSAPSEQTKNGTIIWHAPRTGAGATAKSNDTIIWDDPKSASAPTGTPDKNGIIWDEPKVSKPVQSAAAPSQPSSPAPDRNGIVWNDAPGKSQATKDQTAALPVPPSTSTLPPPQANGAGPCREFESDVTIEGQHQQMRGTACRQPDGRWRVVSQAPR